MKLQISKSDYFRLSEQLPEIRPDIKFKLHVADDNLKSLGFCTDIPCIVEFELTPHEYDNLMSDLIQLEVDAFNTEDGSVPLPTDPYYQKYLKYGWIWDLFCNAKKITEDSCTGPGKDG